MSLSIRSKVKNSLLVAAVLVALAAGAAISGIGAPLLMSTLASPTDADTLSEANYYYLANWEWFQEEGDSYWRCPGGDCVGLVNLRSVPQASRVGGVPEGFGFFAYAKQKNIPNSIYLGTNNKLENRAQIKNVLGLSQEPTEATPIDLLWDLLVYQGDPTGQTKWKPLRGNPEDGVKLYMAGEMVRSEAADKTSKAFQNTIDVFRADYRRNKADGVPLESLNKWTGDTMKKMFGEMSDKRASLILPQEYLLDGWKQPETTITESFNTADSDILGPDLTWQETAGDWDVVSNEAVVKGNVNALHLARATSSLSSADHYAQIVLTTLLDPTTGTNRAGPMARFQSDADTGYAFRRRQPSGATADWSLFMFSAGAGSQISAGWTTEALSLPETIKVQVNGSTITGFIGGTEKDSVTEGTITGNLLAGIEGFKRNTGNAVILDNFEAGDLGASVTCDTPLTASAFGTIDNTDIFLATSSTTTVDCAACTSGFTMTVYGAGSGAGDNPGLWKSPDLISSPTSTATTTLLQGVNGYGLQATSTSASGINIDARFNWATDTSNVVGGLATTSATAFIIASSTAAVSSQIVTVSYKAAVAVAQPSGVYADTITFTCTVN